MYEGCSLLMLTQLSQAYPNLSALMELVKVLPKLKRRLLLVLIKNKKPQTIERICQPPAEHSDFMNKTKINFETNQNLDNNQFCISRQSASKVQHLSLE